jgi:hypothetical protein
MKTKKFIPFGINFFLNNSLVSEKGNLVFEEENLKVKYIIGKPAESKSNDLVFYFHGVSKNEFEWAERWFLGEKYNKTAKTNKQFNIPIVVSVTFGMAFLLKNNLPKPFKADVENIFINKIIPYFRHKLGCSGKIYLIGHSMGGLNVLSLSLRYPELFPVTAAVSPFLPDISPYSANFRNNLRKHGMDEFQISVYQAMLKIAFKNDEEWNNFSPCELVRQNNNFPYICLSSARYDYLGFENMIKKFTGLLNEKGIEYFYCRSNFTHYSTCDEIFQVFFRKISNL